MPLRHNILLISDFNVINLASYFNNDEETPLMNAEIAPFGQVMTILTNEAAEIWQKPYESIFIWTRPENILKSFNKVLDYENILLEEILKEVEEYANVIWNMRHKSRFIFVSSWASPFYHRGYGFLDLKEGGINNILNRVNLKLSECLGHAPNIYLLNTQKWIEPVGKDAVNPKLWYMGKIAFGNEVFSQAMKDVKAAVTGLSGQAKKLIVLDLDNTLWGGILGEVGFKELKLGGHDHIGEAYLDFQRALKALRRRGILLAIASKNDEAGALEAIKNHPEMVLRLNDFVSWKINWQDKAQNIVDLVSELNLGLQSVVFIDDNPLERARVREALPEVYVPEWPQDCMLYKSTFLNLRCFDAPLITAEDQKRTEMYVKERERMAFRNKVCSLEEWLKGLEIKIKFEELSESNLPRVVQLLNKTNQMNLATRRLSELELMAWVKGSGGMLWAVRVWDKFGDYGLTGIVSFEAKRKTGKIIDFVLSCRVIGRKVEETMLYVVLQCAQARGLQEMIAEYVPTEKNKPCLEFFKKSRFKESGNIFTWGLDKEYLLSDAVKIEGVLPFGKRVQHVVS